MDDQVSMSSRKEQPESGATPRRGRAKGSESEQPTASVNMDELRELITLLQENGLAELELERDNFRVRLRKEVAYAPAYAEPVMAAAPVARPAAPPAATGSSAPVHPGAQAETAASEDQDLHIITSPIVGTFYRSPSPTADVFVKIGSKVEGETVVCIIEAMKLMNEIQAEASGEVVKIYVENGQPVEYGQPLFGIKS
jgi:acetyl-CoA carboxylase biotin carboxyl carrier protein